MALVEASQKVSLLEDSMRKQQQLTEGARRELAEVEARLSREQEAVKSDTEANAALVDQNKEQADRLKKAEDAVQAKQQELNKTIRTKEMLVKKLKSVEEARLEVKKQTEALDSAVQTLEREVQIERGEAEADRRHKADLEAEIAELKQSLESVGQATEKQIDIVKLNANIIKKLEAEIVEHRAEAAKQKSMVQQLEKDREKHGAEASDMSAKFMATVEEVKLRETSIVDLQKKIVESDMKLKTQQTLYEAVRSDRNLYSKNLIESQDEIAEMKRKFKIMNHQIDQLKEEIQQKDQAFIKEHIEHAKADKEKERLKNRLMREKKKVSQTDAIIKNLESELNKLNHIIHEADSERFRQATEYDITINERDILGTQLIRRNDELALLYEKIKIQQQTLSNGEVAYRQRLEDIRVLRLKLNQLRRQLHIQNSSCSNLDALRQEVYTLQNELLQDRTKVKALSEELENPNNTHRWRKLEGSDPGTYEMLTKIQALQKRLIAKTEEVVEKEMLLAEKDKLYVECKNILARQPGPEVAEQLSSYQQALRDRTKSMKATASELNMLQSQVGEYKFEIERLTRELQDTKRRYYETKRRETLQRERERQTLDQTRAALDDHQGNNTQQMMTVMPM